MSKGEASAKRVIALAYFHRYGWWVVMAGLVLIMPERILYILGACSVLFSIWSLIGYKLKWKHIYCSFQNAHRKTMTPHNVRWGQMKKSYGYTIPLVFLVCGLIILFLALPILA